MPELTLLTLNIANPSLERARRQLAWLAHRPEDVFILTETKASEGCLALAEAFSTADYRVVCPEPVPGELGVMIVSKVEVERDPLTSTLPYLPSRAAGVIVSTTAGPLRVLGAYAPSRDSSPEKTDRKRRWLSDFTTSLTDAGRDPCLLLGDLNVLEPDHDPHYSFFAAFEYDFYRHLSTRCGLIDAFRHMHPQRSEHSWVGRTGDGYRYDHAHCSADLVPLLRTCEYVHEPRQTRLSDHSALTVCLNLSPVAPLLTSDPVEAASEPMLF
ncbi:MAG: endonuclease/exonuclease/phosphatase family protein [Pseudonocardiaceae bacterium]